jgi:hypothetical protein
MAATAVYFSVQKADDRTNKTLFSNIGATPATFKLTGGKYALRCKASTYGTVTLQVQLDDATTFVTAATAFSADGFSVLDLPPGTYKLVIA